MDTGLSPPRTPAPAPAPPTARKTTGVRASVRAGSRTQDSAISYSEKKQTFPVQLHRLLDDHQNLISLRPGGGIIIQARDGLEELLPISFASFQQNLRNYNFKWEKGEGRGVYSNSQLTEGNIEEVLKLKFKNKRTLEERSDAGADQPRQRRRTNGTGQRGRPGIPVLVSHMQENGKWSAWRTFSSKKKACKAFESEEPPLKSLDITNMLKNELNSVDQSVRAMYQVRDPRDGEIEAAPGAITGDGDEPAAESLDDTSAPEQPGMSSRMSSLTTPGAKLWRPTDTSKDFKEHFGEDTAPDGDHKISLLVKVSDDVTAVKLCGKAEGEEEKYMECKKGAVEWSSTGEDRESIIRFCMEGLTLKQYNFTIETQSGTDRWAKHDYKAAQCRRNRRPAPASASNVDDNGDDDDDDDEEAAPAAEEPEQEQGQVNDDSDSDSDYDARDPEAEEDESGTLSSLELTCPPFQTSTFDAMWPWILDIIKKSHGLRSRVKKGNVFEQVSEDIFRVMFERATSVEIVGANTTGKQGDDGRDIIVEHPTNTGLETMIADCKSFKKTKASRPHVRSVIGSMMTYRKIVKAQRGTGILLTTTEFTKPAMQCADEFNSLHADAYRNGFRVELWNLNVLRDKLKQKFPDDNAKEEAKMVKGLLGFIIENLQKKNLAEFL